MMVPPPDSSSSLGSGMTAPALALGLSPRTRGSALPIASFLPLREASLLLGCTRGPQGQPLLWPGPTGPSRAPPVPTPSGASLSAAVLLLPFTLLILPFWFLLHPTSLHPVPPPTPSTHLPLLCPLFLPFLTKFLVSQPCTHTLPLLAASTPAGVPAAALRGERAPC